jgi:hypothetical protein
MEKVTIFYLFLTKFLYTIIHGIYGQKTLRLSRIQKESKERECGLVFSQVKRFQLCTTPFLIVAMEPTF